MRWRFLLKALTWELFSCAVAFSITYSFINNWQLSIYLTGTIFVIKVLFYYLHELLWTKIP